MRKYVLIFMSIFFVGCAFEKNYGIFEKDTTYKKAIKQTRKGDIINSLETKALIIATHLNPTLEEYQSDTNESFFVGIYTNISKENRALDDRDFSLNMNNTKYLSIVELKENDPLKAKMPNINEWFRYYVITFQKSKEENLELNFAHKDFGKTQLHFAKQH